MSKASILIVEDEQVVALDLRSSLENSGYQVVGQTNRGTDALQKAGELRPDLVLMDIGLKGEMDGIEAATQIRARFQLPVIFLTAFADEATLRRARSAEPYGYILKPFGERGLASNIEVALYKHGAETKLRESEERFRGVIEHSADGIVLANSQGNVTEWNSAAEHLTGLARPEVLGQRLSDVIFRLHPAESRTPILKAALADRWSAAVENGFATGLDQMTEFEIQTPQGERRVVQTNGFLVQTVGGTLAGASMRNITQRKKLEEALRASEQRYRDIFENAVEGIYQSTPDGRFLSVNAALARIYGYESPEEMIARMGNNIAQRLYVNPEQRVDLRRRLEADGAVKEFDALEYRKDGRQIWTRMKARAVRDASGQTLYYEGFLEDVTERKRAEEAIRQLNTELERRVDERTAALTAAYQELSRALRAKDEFLTNMSHELHTPLTAVLGRSDLLQLDTKSALTPTQLEHVRNIHQNGQQLLTLITDMLDLARIAASQLMLEIRPVSVAAICRAAERATTPRAAQKQISVSLALDPAVTVIRADEQRLRQILVNLLNNAVKFTPKSGRAGLIVSGDALRRVANFTVWDTGVGVAAEDLPRLFQDFAQLDASLARKYEGLGLGLALVRRLVELHGGQIKAESDGLGKGSQFTVSLPWAPGTESRAAQSNPDSLDSGL
jgi:PAS domain S-box-containing protein